MAGVKGRSGRKPKPNASNERQVKAKPGTPKRPEWLRDNAKSIWDSTVKLVQENMPDILSEVDSDALALYCDAWADFLEAVETLRVEGNYRLARRHPASVMKREAADRIESGMKKLGLSPVDRAALKIEIEKDEADDPFQQMAREYQETKNKQKKLKVV